MVHDLLAEGIRAHDQGDRQTATRCYRRILEKRPRHSDAIYLLGVVDFQEGRWEKARTEIRRAVQINPRVPFYYYYLGLAEKALGRKEQGLECFRKGLRLNRELAPLQEETAKVLLELGQPEEALEHSQEVTRIAPDNLAGLNLRGMALLDLRRTEEAREVFLQLVQMKWEYPEAWNNLGNCYHALEQWEPAVDAYRQALRLVPAFPEAWSNLAEGLRRLNRLDEAMAATERALELDPQHVEALVNQGTILQIRGEMARSEGAYRRALELQPDRSLVFSNWLFSTLYREDLSAEEVAARHREYGRRFGREGVEWNGKIEPREGRPLRVGLVSADFKWHSVSYFLEGFLRHHDRGRLQLTAYSGVRKEDGRTEEFRHLTQYWREAGPWSDDRLAEQIRQDRIDILIDLSGHTEANRLPVFAQRPAPVQVSWLGYPHSTGLPGMDFRLSDAWTEPEGIYDGMSSESIYRLPQGFHCFTPHPRCPEPEPGPAERGGAVTFGSYNYVGKVSRAVVACWAELLRRVPESRLVLKSHTLGDATLRGRFERFFREEGIEPGRVDLQGFRGRVEEHLASYAQIDVALDPFPYNGTTTTCEALWMGVPVVALAGDRHAGRVGQSLLHQVGHPEWVGADPENYLQIAAGLARDPAALAGWRRSLRKEMAASSLRDEKGFCRKLEWALEAMWDRRMAVLEPKEAQS